MRTTKFRIKSTKYKNTWVYFDLEKSEKNPLFDRDLQLDPETVGQFTGVYDDNEKEIYEGDIIHIKGLTINKDFGVVTWLYNGYFYIDDSFGEFSRDCAKTIGDFFERIKRDFINIEITVNGNIHDNPELIKKEE